MSVGSEQFTSRFQARVAEWVTDLGALATGNFAIVAAAAALVEVWVLSGIFYGAIPPSNVPFTKTAWVIFLISGAAIPAGIFYLSRPAVNRQIVATVLIAASFLTAWYVLSTHRLFALPLLALELYFVRGTIARLRSGPAGGAAAFGAITLFIIGGWFVSTAMTGTYIFDDVVLGKTETATFPAMFIALLCGVVIAAIAFRPATAPSVLTRGIDVIAIIAFITAAARRDPGFVNDDHHISFFLGPADLVRHGGTLLWDVASQYGIFNIWLVAHLPFPDTYSAFVYLNAAVTLTTAILLYVALRLINRSPLGAAASAVIVLGLVYVLAGAWWANLGFEHFPQIGGIRWIWPYVFVALLLNAYIRNSPRADRLTLVAGNICWLFAVAWSAESGIYATWTWFLAAALIAGRHYGRRGIAVTWLSALGGLVAVIVLLEFISFVRGGHGLDWYMYLEFGFLYENGVVAWPFDTQGPFWILATVFGVMAGLAVTLYRTGRRQAIPLAVGLCGMLWSVSSYFIMRSHPNNVNNLIQFQILALAVGIFIAQREKLEERFILTMRLVPIPLAAMAFALTFGTTAFASALASGVWWSGPLGNLGANARQIANAGPDVNALLARNGITPADRISFLNTQTGEQLPPARPGDHGFPAETLPMLPPLLIEQLPVAREITIFQRYAKRFASGGYIVDVDGAADPLHTAIAAVGSSTIVDRSGALVLRKWTAEEAPASAPVSVAPRGRDRGGEYSFSQSFANGTINSNTPAGTPSGKGVFVLQVPYRHHPAPTITVLGGYTYSYTVAIKPNDILTFAAAAPLGVGAGSIGFVDITADGKTQRVFAHDLLPALPTGPVWLDDVRVPLQAFAGKTVTLTFGASPRLNNPNGAWATFVDPKLAPSANVPTH